MWRIFTKSFFKILCSFQKFWPQITLSLPLFDCVGDRENACFVLQVHCLRTHTDFCWPGLKPGATNSEQVSHAILRLTCVWDSTQTLLFELNKQVWSFIAAGVTLPSVPAAGTHTELQSTTFSLHVSQNSKALQVKSQVCFSCSSQVCCLSLILCSLGTHTPEPRHPRGPIPPSTWVLPPHAATILSSYIACTFCASRESVCVIEIIYKISLYLNLITGPKSYKMFRHL